jgi:PAS domain S-box-containing protein
MGRRSESKGNAGNLSPKRSPSAAKKTIKDLLKRGALQNAILNSENFSSIATDEKGIIQLFNVGAERMLGYKASEVVDRLTPADISDPQEVIERSSELSLEFSTQVKPGFESLVYKASRGIEDIYELTKIRKDGSRFPAVVSVTSLRDAQGRIIGYLLISTDNTARKLAEAEKQKLDRRLRENNTALENARFAAETANRTKSDFLANMSHELRTPLNSILGFSEVLADELFGKLNERQKEYAKDIYSSGKHLLDLINDILDLAKVESGKMELELSGF